MCVILPFSCDVCVVFVVDDVDDARIGNIRIWRCKLYVDVEICLNRVDIRRCDDDVVVDD